MSESPLSIFQMCDPLNLICLLANDDLINNSYRDILQITYATQSLTHLDEYNSFLGSSLVLRLSILSDQRQLQSASVALLAIFFILMEPFSL